MSAIKIVFVDSGSLPVPLPPMSFEHELICYPSSTPDELLPRCRGAEVIIVNKAMLTRDLLQQCPRLRLVAIAATGVNNVDLPACEALGIAVCNVRHYGDDAIAEHALMFMLALNRGLPRYLQRVQQGEWVESKQFCLYAEPLQDLSGKTLVIIGSGGIGQAVASRARAFGMQVLFAERKGVLAVREGYCSFEEGLARADILTLHCMLSDATRNMIGASELVQMKRGAVLINTARGGLVDEVALLAALQQGHLAGAGMDVLTEEPPSRHHPLMQVQLPNLIITPHIAWASNQAMTCLVQQVVTNITSFLAGEPYLRVI